MLIQNLAIQNFKSIQNLHLTGFNRINLFIGRPNVGKSNIIEALSLFSLFYLPFGKLHNITSLMRLENGVEMFYNGNMLNNISIETEVGLVRINSSQEINLQIGIEIEYLTKTAEKFSLHYQLDEHNNIKQINNKLIIQKSNAAAAKTVVKKYSFTTEILPKSSNYVPFLLPPFGNNLLQTLEHLPNFKAELVHIFSEYGLKLVFDKASQSLKIMKEQRDGSIFLLPYSSIADTLQRIIFYKTAVASNQNSVLLFEEPEAHAFPPYIVEITQEIIRSKTNQFFITTHSPFIVNDFLENAIDDLAIFMLDYKDGQTIAKALTKEQLHEVYEYGVDLFTNNENYL
jgi:AAA15 family ATPase/GTPase